MLYPTRAAGGNRRPARPGEELALGAALLFLVSAFLAAIGEFQWAFSAFGVAMACLSLRISSSTHEKASEPATEFT